MRAGPATEESPPLERGGELAELAALAAAARSRSGRLVVVDGPAGIGKTRLLEVVCSEARRSGMSVLRARGAEMERDLGFGAVHQLFGALVRGASGAERRRLLAGPASLVEPIVLGVPAGGQRIVEDRFVALHGLYWLCANLADRDPLVLAIDDAQWADLPTLRWVQFLSRRLDGLSVLVVIAVRSDEPLDSGEELSEIRAGAETRTLRLSPLSGAAVATMVRAGMGQAVARKFCRACLEATGGNPFYVRELIAGLVADGVLPTAAAAATVQAQSPRSIAEAVAHRLRRHPSALRFAEAVALLGRGPDLQHAAALAGLNHDAAAAAADMLATMHVLRPGRPLDFVHPIVRAAIYGSLPHGVRALLHRRAASLLAVAGETPDAVAAQLLVSDPAGEQWSVDALRRAAWQAMARGAPESALTYLRRALAEGPPPAARVTVLREAGEAAFLCGDPEAGDYLRRALALEDEPVKRAQIAQMLGGAMLLADRVESAVDVLSLGLQQLSGAETALSMGIETQLIATGLLQPSTCRLSRERLSRWRPEVLPDSVDGRRLAACLAFCSTLEGQPATAVRELAEQALDAGRLLAENTAAGAFFNLAANALATADWLELALLWFDRALDDARARGSLTGFTAASCFRADANYRAGRLADAEADAWAALSARHVGQRSLLAPIALAGLIQVLVERGEPKAAAAVLARQGIDPDAGDGLGQCALRYARGKLRVSQGLARDALKDLLDCGSWLDRWGSRNPSLWPWRSHAALALATVGQLGEARRLTALEVELARPLQQPRTLGMALRAAGLVEAGDRGLEMLREAVEVLESSYAPLEHARALTDMGSAMRRRGRPRDARIPLREGLDLADRCGATEMAARARQELLAAGGRPRRPRLSGAMALTPSERRVAQMASQGLSNPEIAQALFVSVKTVETHLSRGYDKLGIADRTQLTGALASRPLSGQQLRTAAGRHAPRSDWV